MNHYRVIITVNGFVFVDCSPEHLSNASLERLFSQLHKVNIQVVPA